MSRLRRILLFPLTRLLIAALVFAAVMAAGAFAGLLVVPERWLFGDGMEALAAQQVLQVIAAVAALLFVGTLIERRRPEEFGLRARGAGRDLLLGFLIGAGVMCAIVGVLALAGWYVVTAPLGGGASRLLLAMVLFFLVGLSEEVLFRGILFRIVEEGLGSWLAIAASGLIFGVVHVSNPNGTVIAGLAIAVDAGIQLGAAYMLTRSLWLAVGIHWAWNLFEGPVFGLPVSGIDLPVLVRAEARGPDIWTGGAFGPEAGLVSVVLSGAVGVWLLVRAARRGQVIPPFWARRPRPEGPPAADAFPDQAG